jgi:hypothetical protein
MDMTEKACAQGGTKRIGIPAEEVVERVLGFASIAVGNAEDDKAARTKARGHFGQKGGRIGLMLVRMKFTI